MSFKLVSSLRMLAVFLGLSVAFFLEYLGAKPCALCIFQRFIFIVLFMLFFMQCFLAQLHTYLRKALSFLIVLFSLSGVVLALRHLWLIFNPTDGSACLPHLDYLLNHAGYFKTLFMLMTHQSDCAKDLTNVLGVLLPIWLCIAYLVNIIVEIYLIKK